MATITNVGQARMDKLWEAYRQRVAQFGRFSKAIDNDFTDHAMICLKPPMAVTKKLLGLDEATEDDLDDSHITLVYLGEVDDLGGHLGRERLYRAVYDFVLHQSPTDGLTGFVGGYGVFHNDGKQVLVALWDILGVEGVVASLADTLRRHGIPTDAHTHGYTAHQTLSYDDDAVRLPGALPDGLPKKVGFEGVYIAWGGDPWQLVPFTGSAGADALA